MLVTSRPTVTSPRESGADTLRLANEKVVYDSPNPNGNSGVTLFASFQRYPTWSFSE